MSHLIVFDALNDVPKSLGIIPKAASVYLLSFNPDKQVVDQVLGTLRHQGVEVQYITAAGKLDSAALQAREKFSKLVAEIPVTFKIGRKNLKEAFTFEDRLSSWWLNDLSSKRSDREPTFTRICQLEVIREIVRSVSARTIHLITQDRDFWDVVAAYCQQTGVDLRSRRPQNRYGSMMRRLLVELRILKELFLWFLRTGIQTLLAKILIDSGMVEQYEGKRPCAFYTHYPGMWRGTGGKRDEKYARVPDLVEKICSIPSVYACTFISDGFHESASIRQFYSYCRWLRTERRTASGPQIRLIDADLTWRDFWRALVKMSIVWKYALLERNPEFQSQWNYDGVNIFPLIRREFRLAMRRIPRYLLHAMRIRSFVKKVNPVCLVTYLFEFCYGRAMLYGVKSAKRSIPVVGVQHGPCAKRKLLYYHSPGEILPNPERPDDFIQNMPIPDYVIVEGHSAKECLAEAGYPTARLRVGGAPRLGRLVKVPRKGGKASGSNRSRRTVLVVFGQHDGLTILSLCRPVMARRFDSHFVFKLHPRSGTLTPQKVDQQLVDQHLASTYEVASGSIYELIADADAVVVTYSSVGMEAAALGYPVICLHTPDRVTQNPLLDLDIEGVVFWAADSTQLDLALDRAFGIVENACTELSRSNDTSSRRIERYFFDKLDGNADNRWAQIIAGVLGTGGSFETS